MMMASSCFQSRGSSSPSKEILLIWSSDYQISFQMDSLFIKYHFTFNDLRYNINLTHKEKIIFCECPGREHNIQTIAQARYQILTHVMQMVHLVKLSVIMLCYAHGQMPSHLICSGVSFLANSRRL